MNFLFCILFLFCSSFILPGFGRKSGKNSNNTRILKSSPLKRNRIPIDCPSDTFCETIVPDKPNEGMYTKCRESERGNDDSKKICSVTYVLDGSPRVAESNPNENKCDLHYDENSNVTCDTYIKTHTPYVGYINGVKYVHCYMNATPYFCKTRRKTYIVCSIVAADCTTVIVTSPRPRVTNS